VIVLLGIGFLAGVVTAISPCVLPVLPIILAGSAAGGRRRPLAIIAGLVLSFSLFLLVGTWLLDLLGLPQDFLRNVAIGLLFLLAAMLVLPRLGVLVERPLARLGRRPGGELGGGFLLGLSLGLVFVPCAGPVLTAMTVVAAAHRAGLDTVFLTFAYALGAAVPMLLIAIGGQRLTDRVSLLRRRAATVRVALGVVIAATALAIVFNLDRPFQTSIPGYTNALQRHLESNSFAKRKLGKLTGAGQGVARAAGSTGLADYGQAPEFRGISRWLNTPEGRALSMRQLRGKVVLIDFWTYSCINCLRTLPHLEAWYATYHSKGFTIIGVHTPEFAFEHVPSNVSRAVEQLGVRYPVPLDNDYGTWNAYNNQYWPAEYLIDRRGDVRHAHFGEGEYERTERLIRTLLSESTSKLPVTARLSDPTPREATTPESYLGFDRLERYAGSEVIPNRRFLYRLPRAVPLNKLAYGGSWRVERQKIIAGRSARLRLHFLAKNVYLVLGGNGRLGVSLNGRAVGQIRIAGISRLYRLQRYQRVREGLLELRFTPGLSAYAFTFG
jgi:cytochrome c biogenesis protein CcdA/thiol-disulfide isomerase/thioredoxin